MCAIPTATRRRRSLKHWLNPRSWRLVLLVFLAFVLLPLPSVVESQYSAHCHFNQLCSCRVVPVKRPQNGLRSTLQPSSNNRGGRGPPSSATTTSGPTYTYTGQFGIIIPETTPETSTEDYDDYEPLFSLGLRSPRQAGSSRKKQHWEVQDINCQGIPFTTIPGKLLCQLSH